MQLKQIYTYSQGHYQHVNTHDRSGALPYCAKENQNIYSWDEPGRTHRQQIFLAICIDTRLVNLVSKLVCIARLDNYCDDPHQLVYIYVSNITFFHRIYAIKK